MKILFFGDLVGRPARNALKKILPIYKKRYDYDFVVANCDNLAHGRGVTRNTLDEISEYGVNAMTSGDHIWDTSEAEAVIKDRKGYNFLCPANFPKMGMEKGYRVFNAGKIRIMVINLAGRVFFQRFSDCPFMAADMILKENENKFDVAIVDFHAEATSEKRALGEYLDSRVCAVLGTHTHIQTADEQISKEGTAYITDVGMVGSNNSIIGCKKEVVIQQMLDQIPFRYEISDDDNVLVNAVLIEIGQKDMKAEKILRINEQIS